MSNLINRDALLEKSYCVSPATWDNPYGGESVVSVDDIENAPAVDAVLVIRCKDCGYYHRNNLVCDRPFESPVCRLPDDFCSKGVKKVKRTRFHIDDFIDDFNYENIAFDITDVDKQALESKLQKDYVNHLYELENANYIAIWNCDLQGFEKEDDIFFDSDNDRDYKLCKLVNVGEAWFYDVVDENKKISYWNRFGKCE